MKKVSNIKNLNFEQRVITQLPYSDNISNPRKAFNQEAKYQFENSNKKLFNKNYGNVYYCKKNEKNQTILPNLTYIVEMPDLKNPVYCFNFVADAYRNFLRQWKIYENRGVIQGEPFNVYPVSGYVNFEDEMSSMEAEIGSNFRQFVSLEKYEQKITNLDSFLMVFSKFIASSTPLQNITASKFIESKKCKDDISGLVLNLANTSKNSFIEKDKILKNPKFKLLNETLQSFGFAVSKSEPWKVYFNMFSPRAKAYVDRYLESSEFYDQFFVKSQVFDIFYLQKMVLNLYFSYIQEKPYFNLHYYEKCNNNIIGKKQKIFRETVDSEFIQKTLNEKIEYKWWRLYIFALVCQNNLDLLQQKFDLITREAYDLYHRLDISASLSYLEGSLREIGKSRSKDKKFIF